MKMKFLTLACLMFLTSIYATAQKPDWVEYGYRTSQYPEDLYLIGYNSETNVTRSDPQEMMDRLSGYARNQLVESIVVEIKSISMLNVINANATTHEDFKKMSVSFSKASIAGLKTETWYDEKESIAYALVYAKRTDVIQYYENQVASLVDQINTSFELARTQKNNGNKQEAFKTLFQVQTLIKETENAQTLLVTLTGDYEYPGIKRPETKAATLKVEDELNAIRNTEQNTIEDAAFFIAFALKTQTEGMGMPVRVMNFSYQDTPMSSAFSRRFQSALTQKMIDQGFPVADEVSSNELVLKGTYWEEEDKIKVSAILRDAGTSAAVGSVDSYLPKSVLDASNIAYQPENYKQALVNMQEFAENEIKGGGLTIDVYTNKGKENLIYTEGEILRLFVRANRECYLRFVYHLADGSKVLLLDNYYINRDNVNQTYELPYEFECAEPFGVETLQLNAQAEKFDPLNIREEYGYNFIMDGSKEIIANTRGFKKKEPKDSEVLKAEKRLVFTTMSQ